MRRAAPLLALLAGGAAAQSPPGALPAPLVPLLALPIRAEIAPEIGCDTLAGRRLALPGAATEVLTAAIVPSTPDLPEHCRITGRVDPQVGFELRLPTTGYVGRYLQVGCGGNCGYVRPTLSLACDDRMAKEAGFAVAATDAGHRSPPGDTSWARDNPQAQRDFAERGVHVTALAAKTLIAAYYGRAPDHSYFHGCSDGGREGMKEAQLYPADFDGIVAGAPANYISSGFLRFAWQEARNTGADGKPIWTKSAGETLHAAVMKACDGIDGLVDGQIDAPRACRYDPVDIACPAVNERPDTCLSSAQVATARAFYSGPVDDSGRHLWLGGMARGSELTWIGGSRRAMVEGYFSDMLYGSRRPGGVKLEDIAFTRENAHEVMRLGARYDAYTADLTAFRQRGGRMIVWEGAADPSAGPHATLNYYQSVRDSMGGLAATQRFMRLFILPGVYHCGRGTMPYEANMLGAIVRWVELGEAPDKVIAAARKPDGNVRTRPIYAYPVAARYMGSGSIDDAANFRPAPPQREPNDRFDWIGTPKETRR